MIKNETSSAVLISSANPIYEKYFFWDFNPLFSQPVTLQGYFNSSISRNNRSF